MVSGIKLTSHSLLKPNMSSSGQHVHIFIAKFTVPVFRKESSSILTSEVRWAQSGFYLQLQKLNLRNSKDMIPVLTLIIKLMLVQSQALIFRLCKSGRLNIVQPTLKLLKFSSQRTVKKFERISQVLPALMSPCLLRPALYKAFVRPGWCRIERAPCHF